MNLTRLRQYELFGPSTFLKTTRAWWGHDSEVLTRANTVGEAKSTYDVGPVYNVFVYSTEKKGRRFERIGRQRVKSERIPGKFLPFSVSSIVRGNAKYDGKGFAYSWNRSDGSMCRTEGQFMALPHYAMIFPYPHSYTSFPERNPSQEQWCLQQCVASASEPVHAMGVTLGELAETVKMLLSPSRAIANVCKRAGTLGGSFIKPSKSNRFMLFKPAPNVPKKFAERFGKKISIGSSVGYIVNTASDFWLTWRFGVEPLVKEIGDIMSLDWAYWDDPSIRMAKKRFVESRNRQTVKDQAYSIGTNFYVCVDYQHRWEYYTQASISYRVNRGYGIDEALNGYGLSLRHLPSVIWELTPLSFVIDRFVDVSTLIGSLTPDPNVSMINNCVSRNLHAYTDFIFRSHLYYGVPLPLVEARVNPFRVFTNSYIRVVEVPISVWPQINPRLTTLKQYVDHATLLWQRIPKFK